MHYLALNARKLEDVFQALYARMMRRTFLRLSLRYFFRPPAAPSAVLHFFRLKLSRWCANTYKETLTVQIYSGLSTVLCGGRCSCAEQTVDM